MKFNLLKQLRATKKASQEIAILSAGKKKKILLDIADELLANKKLIMRVNKKDIVRAKRNGKSIAFIDRLTLSEKSFTTMVNQVRDIAKQTDYIGEVIEEKTLMNGVVLKKIRVAIGVIGVIYESRPNVTIDIAALCIKSGNAVVLRGGSDAYATNAELVAIIHKVFIKQSITKDAVGFICSTNRDVVAQIVQQHMLLDVIIPRGGYNLVKKVVEQSKIAVLYHASGGARIYIDKSAQIEEAVKICVNAKISRPATCNSLDTILVHKKIAKEFIISFQKKLTGRAEIRGDAHTLRYIAAKKATQEDYATEFLDYIVSMKVVNNEKEALDHIARYTNHHSEGIVAEDKKVIQLFTQHVDAAALFVNCSTRLHDGGIFALGAEMGIATGKLHARGPVGAREMTTYKWVAYGKGQIRE